MHKTPLGPLAIGEDMVYILNVGDLRHDTRGSLNLPESAWQGRYDALFADWVPVPVQAALIRAANAVILVDAPSSDLGPHASDFSIPGYTPPPGLISQLASLGVGPDDVTHIVITHTHFDHLNGLAVARDGRSVALYPNATLYVGRADWERVDLEHGAVDETDLNARMLAPYAQTDRVTPVDGILPLTSTVTIMPSPGETPGHLSVRVQDGSVTLYCIGDVYHHAVEVENRSWTVSWVDAQQTIAERLKLEKAALAEDAMLMASHMRGVGRLVRAGEGVRWQELLIAG